MATNRPWAMGRQAARIVVRAYARPRLPIPQCRLLSRFASSSSSSSHSSSSSEGIPAPPQPPRADAKPQQRQKGFYLPLSLLVLIPTIYYLRSTPSPALSPNTYSDHPISSSASFSSWHRLVTTPLSPTDLALFGHPPDPNTHDPPGEIMIQHMMVRNPDLQIERPYTPINDVSKDGEIQMVIKRVKGGEVGRHVHSLAPPQAIGLRGPLPTFSICPSEWDKVVMMSSGTGVAPFLQLLSKVPVDKEGGTKYHLLHATSKSPESDWIQSPTLPLLERLQRKLGETLRVDRLSLDPIDRSALARALQVDKNEKLMVLVCLPPHLMRTICGPLTITLGQGELTGVLKDLGFTSKEVWKLE